MASNNLHKLEEVRIILPDDIIVTGLKELGFNQEIPETGNTLEENARIKTARIALEFNEPCFADDTGLEIDSLQGRPGVISARYAGEPPDAQKNMELVLTEMKGIKERTCRFRTVISYFDGETYHEFEGVVSGHISTEAIGDHGFGYDPIFIPNGYDRTFGQLSSEEKNQMSHRSRALDKFLNHILDERK